MQASTETYKHTNPALFYGGAAVVDYYGADNDNYVAGEGFCCGDNNLKTKSIADDSPNYEKLQYYYHSDHLGSASYITNLDGEVVQHIEYVPFGEVFLEERNNTWNTPFLFNGKELDEETGLYYYGARYYNPRISLWYGVDPLFDKYPSMSPYNYCANNPIKYIDPDGRKIVYAKDVSPTFKAYFKQAVQHLNKHGAGGMLASLENSEKVYYINEINGISHYNLRTNTINWDPSKGIMTNDGHMLSPTAVLNHEVDHALQHDTNPELQQNDLKTIDNDYGDKEEKRVIEGSEQKTALKLGEIKSGEVTRRDHGGYLYDAKEVTSTEWKDEVIVKPENISK